MLPCNYTVLMNITLVCCVRTSLKLEVPFLTQLTRSSGKRYSTLMVGRHICCATLKSTPTLWYRTWGRPTWDPSPSSLTTWVSIAFSNLVASALLNLECLVSKYLPFFFTFKLSHWIFWTPLQTKTRFLDFRRLRRCSQKSWSHLSCSQICLPCRKKAKVLTLKHVFILSVIFM